MLRGPKYLTYGPVGQFEMKMTIVKYVLNYTTFKMHNMLENSLP